MSILNASSLGQSFGSFDLFSGITVGIPNDGKIGLVGPNGVGKTTLLMILAGLARPSSGSVHRARGKQLGYLPQESAEAFAGHDHNVFDEMLTVFSELREEEQRLRDMEDRMADGDSSEELLLRYGAAQEKFELDGGYDFEIRIRQVLQGLGFSAADWRLPLAHLSGGQKTRALMARLLLEEPDLLILDEPTNHLDVQAIEWLEGVLRMWDGAVLLVSHDRFFMDRVINTVWEMRSDGIESYRGNYSSYVQQRQERWELRRKKFAAQRERLEKELEYVRRNIAGQRTQMARGKLSRLSRELDAIQKAGMEAVSGKSWSEISDGVSTSRYAMSVAEATAAIKGLKRPDGGHRTFDVRLKAGRRSGKIILRTKNLAIGYPDKALFGAEDIELHRLECAALIGPNGTGKTTFLRTILGELGPLKGEIQLGASLEIGYFAQAHDELIAENSVIDELIRHQPMQPGEARAYLGSYLFSGDDVYKPVFTLSGGERGRLALSILALSGANFLLLDEPTNHLDIPAQEMLQEVLESFDGTILLVTHDRYLVDHLASQIWSLENNLLRVYKGSYQEFLAERAREAERAQEKAVVDLADRNQRSNHARFKENETKKQQERLARLEQEIHDYEQQREKLAHQLQNASEEEAFDRIQSVSIEYTAVEKQLEGLMAEWEKLAHEQTLAE